VILYAGINDYLEKVPVTKVKEYEEKLYSYMEAKHANILKEIKEKKELSKELEEKLKKSLAGFNKEVKFE
jgi:F-type H+-transporting ATPase subunit alpha